MFDIYSNCAIIALLALINAAERNMNAEEKAPPKTAPPRGSQINVRVDPDLKKKAKICANLKDSTLEDWCVRILRDAIESQLKGTKLPFDQPATPFSIRVMV